MRKVLALGMCAAAVAIAGCNQKYEPQHKAQKSLAPAGSKIKYTEACIEGVVYYYLYYMDATAYSASLAPAFGQDSKVKTCNKEPS